MRIPTARANSDSASQPAISVLAGDLCNTDQTLVGLQLRPLAPGYLEMARPVHEHHVTQATAGPPDLLTPRRARGRYVLRLYVTGMTRRSIQAIANLRQICETRLQGRYELEVLMGLDLRAWTP